MAEELETKILKGDADELEKLIVSRGAKKVFDDTITALFYDTPDMTLKKNKKCLRLRLYGSGEGYITTKHKQSSANDAIVHNLEPEFSSDNLEAVHQSYLILGFMVRGPVVKHRVSYELEGIRFEFDNYDNAIPRFVEVEAKNHDDVKRGVELLGFTMDDTDNRNMFELMEAYGVTLEPYTLTTLPKN